MLSSVLDLYLEKKSEGKSYKTWIIDINPWIPLCVEGLLFSWESLDNPDMLDMSQGPDFRIIIDKNLIRADDNHEYRVPVVSLQIFISFQEFEDMQKMQEFISEISKKS